MGDTELPPGTASALAAVLREMEVADRERADGVDAGAPVVVSSSTPGDPRDAPRRDGIHDSLESHSSGGGSDENLMPDFAARVPHEQTDLVRDIHEMVAEALGEGEADDKLDCSREGEMLETVVPYDFDPVADTILVEIPRGFGAVSGQTMEIASDKFTPGAAVAIPVPRSLINAEHDPSPPSPKDEKIMSRDGRENKNVSSEAASPPPRGDPRASELERANSPPETSTSSPVSSPRPTGWSMRSLWRSTLGYLGAGRRSRENAAGGSGSASPGSPARSRKKTLSTLGGGSDKRAGSGGGSRHSRRSIVEDEPMETFEDEYTDSEGEGAIARIDRLFPNGFFDSPSARGESGAGDPGDSASSPDRAIPSLRGDSFSGMVQRADSLTVPNAGGGRCHRVIVCQGLTFDMMDSLYAEDAPEPSSSTPHEDHRGVRVVEGANRARASTGSSAPGASGGRRARAGRPVDEANLPGVSYLDERPFARGGFAEVYRGAFVKRDDGANEGLVEEGSRGDAKARRKGGGAGAIAVAIKVMEYRVFDDDGVEDDEDDDNAGDGSKGRSKGSPKASEANTTTRGGGSDRRARDQQRSLSRSAKREAEIVRTLDHANVVTCLMQHSGPAAGSSEDSDPGSSPGGSSGSPWRTVIVTDFCIGGSLSTVLRSPALVSASKRVRSTAAYRCVVGQVASGMTYLHARGVVHGDVKASNVLLHPDADRPSRWLVKLADFGVSHVLEPGETKAVLKRVNGTVSHMAPELLRRSEVSRASDAYAFAILLWELAAHGARAFEGVAPVNIIVAVAKNDLRPRFPVEAFEPMRRLAQRCWASDPEARPGFDAVAREVDAWAPLVSDALVVVHNHHNHHAFASSLSSHGHGHQMRGSSLRDGAGFFGAFSRVLDERTSSKSFTRAPSTTTGNKSGGDPFAAARARRGSSAGHSDHSHTNSDASSDMPMSTASLLSVQDARGVDTNFEVFNVRIMDLANGGGASATMAMMAGVRRAHSSKSLAAREEGREGKQLLGEANEGAAMKAERARPMKASSSGARLSSLTMRDQPRKEGERGGDNEAE